MKIAIIGIIAVAAVLIIYLLLKRKPNKRLVKYRDLINDHPPKKQTDSELLDTIDYLNKRAKRREGST